MIAKKFKLKRNLIKRTLSKGEEVRSRFFIIRYEKNNEKIPQYCVIISKKISNKATIRNRLRRVIYEAIRTSGLLEIENHDFNIILIPKKTVLEKDFGQLQADICTFPNLLTSKNEQLK